MYKDDLLLFRANGGPDPRDYQLSSVYAINRIVREFRIAVAHSVPEVGKEKIGLTIAPYLYDAETRSFQQMGFADNRWDQPVDWSPDFIDTFWGGKSKDGRLKEIFDFFTLVDASGFAAARPRSNLKLVDFVPALEKIQDVRKRNMVFEATLKSLEYGDWVALYAYYKFQRGMYLNGIYWDICSENPDIDAILMRRYRPILTDRSSEQWVTWVKRHEADYEVRPAQRQVLRSKVPRGTDFALALSDYFVQGKPNLSVDEPIVESESLPETDTIALIPIYGIWLAGRGFGRVCATLQIAFDKTRYDGTPYQTRTRFDPEACGPTPTERQVISRLLEMAEILAIDLTAAAIDKVVAEPLSSRSDLSGAFVHSVQYLQDWEKITVDVSGGSVKTRVYERYKYIHSSRQPSDGDCQDHEVVREDIAMDGWDSKLSRGAKNGGLLCKELEPCADTALELQWSDSRDSLARGGSGTAQAEVHLDNVFSGIDTGALVRPTAASFLFPRNARIPNRCSGNAASQALWRAFLNAVVRQQKELLSALAPRLVARRSAARTAVSAIMGRNMSHNIGSHVLARYSSAIKDDRDETAKDKADHRGEFLAYLQRRMDFLAEIATADKAYWAQALSLSDQVRCLNFDAQRRRTGHDPILLARITGKEKLKATVEFGSPRPTSDGCVLDTESADVLFSCPGGEVGVHSLFCILENVIRNSARHGNDESQPEVRIFVAVVPEDPEAPKSDLIKVAIADPRTQLTREGGIVGRSRDRKEGELDSLDQEINRILQEESLLDTDGSPNPHYWGVREMQICAHYLRGLPLSDLELQGNEEAPVLSAYVHPLGGERFCLGYRLYLQRAKLAAVVAPAHTLSTFNAIDGVCFVPAKPGITWHEIASAARGYGFLLVDKEVAIKSEPRDAVARASLPVRLVEWERARIAAVFSNASASSSGEMDWMESLHTVIALEYRDKRTQWADRTVWGVAVSTGEALNKFPDLGPSEMPLTGRMNWVRKDSDSRSPVKPLPASWQCAVGKLADIALGAAWIDHPSANDLRSMRGAEFGLAHRPLENKQRMWACAEPAYSGSAHTAYLNESASAVNPKCWEILAAALARVAVIDERVQSAATKDVREIPLSELWASTGVWVPKQDACDLDAPKLAPCKEFLRAPGARPEQFPIDFLVIHLTVLERLRSEEGKQHLGDTLQALISDTEAALAQVIIVTGRGVPTVAGALDVDRLYSARYLPISALLECLIARPSKLGLMRALWSSSRPSPNNTSINQ